MLLKSPHGLGRRDLAIARMTAEALTDTEIAAKLKLVPRTIRKHKAKPAVAQLIQDMAQAYAQQVGKDLAHRVAARAPYTWQFLEDVMDGKYDTIEPKILAVRVAAAAKLLDRQVPKQLKKTEEKTVRFLFERPKQLEIEATLAEAGYELPQQLTHAEPDTPEPDPPAAA